MYFVSGTQDEASFGMGVTSEAQIMLVAKDLEGNVAETLSEPFSITDNTLHL